MTKWRRNDYMILIGAVVTTTAKISNDGIVTTTAMVKIGMEYKPQCNSPNRHEKSNEIQGVT